MPGSRIVRTQPLYGSGESVTVYKQFTRLVPEGPEAKSLSGQVVRLAPVSVSLPAGAVDVSTTMPPVDTTPYTPASDCQDPDVAPVPMCTPDPLRFFTPEDFAVEVTAARERVIEDRYGGQVPVGLYDDLPVLLMQLVDTKPPIGSDPDWLSGTWPGDVDETANPALRAHWEPLTVSRGVTEVPFGEELVELVGDVHYLTRPKTVASQFSAACGAGFPCSRAQELTNELVRQQCVTPAGDEQYYRPQRDVCLQQDVQFWYAPPYQPGTNRLGVGRISQVGYADNHGRKPFAAYDELGLAWDDGANWSYFGESFATRMMDTYWCEGDEAVSSTRWEPGNRPHHWLMAYATSFDNVPWQLGPRGISHPDYRQYEWTAEYSSSFVNDVVAPPWLHFTYRKHQCMEPIGSSYRLHDAVRRTREIYFDADWWTQDLSGHGMAAASWGHVWSEYSYVWKTSFGVTTGGAGVGFTFSPHREERSRVEDQGGPYDF